MQPRPKIECPEVPDQPEPTDPGRGFDSGPVVAPRGAAAEHLAPRGGPSSSRVVDETYDTKVKIGEALEASAREVGEQPVEASDAAAVCVAERHAVEGGTTVPGGVAERAQAAADANARAGEDDDDKVTIADVLTWESTVRLPTGVAVTDEVAATAAEAEAASDPGAATRSGGVSQALQRAAMHNREHQSAA